MACKSVTRSAAEYCLLMSYVFLKSRFSAMITTRTAFLALSCSVSSPQ